jgi:hypothetical protein
MTKLKNNMALNGKYVPTNEKPRRYIELAPTLKITSGWKIT